VTRDRVPGAPARDVIDPRDVIAVQPANDNDRMSDFVAAVLLSRPFS